MRHRFRYSILIIFSCVWFFFSLSFACWNWVSTTLFVLKSFHVRFISIVHVKLVQMFAHSSNFHSIFVWLAVSFLCVKFNKINWSLSVNLFIFQSENELVPYSRLCTHTQTDTNWLMLKQTPTASILMNWAKLLSQCIKLYWSIKNDWCCFNGKFESHRKKCQHKMDRPISPTEWNGNVWKSLSKVNKIN